MPTYDYQCRSCGVITEVVHSMLEDGPTECERCGGVLRRLVHPTGIIFRGSGFYRNDSRSSASGSDSPGSRAGSKPSGDASSTATPSGDGTSGDRGISSTPSAGDAGKGKPETG
ncbi:MAG: FmdB family zinc ribbon protein [Chloroflexota bacterium]